MTSTEFQTERREFRPMQFAVLPGSAGRGCVLGLFYCLFSLAFYAVFAELFAPTPIGSWFSAFQATVGQGGIVALGFILPVSITLFLAWLGYRRREYEITPDHIVERRGIILRSETTITYDDFDGVTVTQSLLQSAYGAGTVLLTDVDREEGEQFRMKLSFIQQPGKVSTAILRNMADDADLTEGSLGDDVPELRVESESLSRVSGRSLAAGTGFRYLMPTAVLHPHPGDAGIYGFLLGLGYSVLGLGVLYYFWPTAMSLTGLESDAHLLAIAGLASLIVAVLLAGWFYRFYDRMQYELYEDHIRVVEGDATTSYALADVADIEVTDRGITSLRHHGNGALPWNDVGHVTLLDDEGDVLVDFEYIGNAAAVGDALREWLYAVQESSSEPAPARTETTPGT